MIQYHIILGYYGESFISYIIQTLSKWKKNEVITLTIYWFLSRWLVSIDWNKKSHIYFLIQTTVFFLKLINNGDNKYYAKSDDELEEKIASMFAFFRGEFENIFLVRQVRIKSRTFLVFERFTGIGKDFGKSQNLSDVVKIQPVLMS